MAELKTYTCDFPGCGQPGAQHLRVPDVDIGGTDPASGRREYLDGTVDLCPDHTQWIITCALRTFDNTQTQRHEFWRRLLGQLGKS